MIDLKNLDEKQRNLVASFADALFIPGNGGSGTAHTIDPEHEKPLFEDIDYTDPEWGVMPEPTRIKITCTEDEKNWIVNAFLTASLCDSCIFRKYCGDDKTHKSCTEVFDREIKWEVHDA